MFVALNEDRLVLRVNGPQGGVRVTHAWTPYDKAQAEFPQVMHNPPSALTHSG